MGSEMAQEQADVRSIPPYVPYKTFRTFIDGLRTAMPSRIDRSLMGTMSGATQGQLISALRYLDLITDNGTPTQKLKDFAKADGEARKEVLADIAGAAYLDVFRGDNVDLDSGTYKQLHEAFAATGANGDTVRKCIAFWLLINKDADLTVSPHFTVRGSRGPARPSMKKKRPATRDPWTTEEDPPAPRPASAAPRTRFEVLLEKFPQFDPSWEADVQAKWFDAFDKLQQLNPDNP